MRKKKSSEPYRICLLNSTANFHPNWARLAGKSEMAPRIFSSLQYSNFHLIFKYETIETHACAFLTLIILAIAGVKISDPY